VYAQHLRMISTAALMLDPTQGRMGGSSSDHWRQNGTIEETLTAMLDAEVDRITAAMFCTCSVRLGIAWDVWDKL
jgi:hypothetical protein